MPKAIVDPRELRQFAIELKRFKDELQNDISGLQSRFLRLGDTWQDAEHVKFAEAFGQMMRALERFVKESEKHVPLLLRKAERIQEYLNQR